MCNWWGQANVSFFYTEFTKFVHTFLSSIQREIFIIRWTNSWACCGLTDTQTLISSLKYFDLTKQKQHNTKQCLLEELDASALLSCGPDAAETTGRPASPWWWWPTWRRTWWSSGWCPSREPPSSRPEGAEAKRHTGHELKCEPFYQVLVFGKFRITFPKFDVLLANAIWYEHVGTACSSRPK